MADAINIDENLFRMLFLYNRDFQILYCIIYHMLRFHISDSGNLVDVIFYSTKWPCHRHPGTYWYGGRHKDMNKIVQSHAEIYLY